MNLYIIIGILVIIIIYLVYLYLVYKKTYEHLTLTNTLNNFANKDIVLMYNNMYLTFIPKANCSNYLKNINKCGYNIPVLQPNKTDYTRFRLKSSFTNANQFRIMNMATYLQPLNANLNVFNNSTLLCGDGTSALNQIYFDYDTINNNTFRFKTLISGTYYYVGLCNQSINCKYQNSNYIQLCLTNNPNMAINFSVNNF